MFLPLHGRLRKSVSSPVLRKIPGAAGSVERKRREIAKPAAQGGGASVNLKVCEKPGRRAQYRSFLNLFAL